MKRDKSLKPRQLNAVKLLALGTPAYQVAQRLEVSVMTLYRWQRLPEFEARLNSVASSGLEEVAKKLNAATLTAIETLQEAMCDMSEPTGTRMKAAMGVLKVMPSVNSILDKSLQHRVGDFDLQQRWGEGFTFDGSGNPCHTTGTGELSPSVIEL